MSVGESWLGMDGGRLWLRLVIFIFSGAGEQAGTTGAVLSLLAQPQNRGSLNRIIM